MDYDSRAVLKNAYTEENPKKQKQVLNMHSRLECEQERTFKLLEELEHALSGVLSLDQPRGAGTDETQQVLPPLGEMIRTTLYRQANINERLGSILNRIEV